MLEFIFGRVLASRQCAAHTSIQQSFRCFLNIRIPTNFSRRNTTRTPLRTLHPMSTASKTKHLACESPFRNVRRTMRREKEWQQLGAWNGSGLQPMRLFLRICYIEKPYTQTNCLLGQISRLLGWAINPIAYYRSETLEKRDNKGMP